MHMMVSYTEPKDECLTVQAEIFRHRIDKNHVESSQQNGGLNAQKVDFHGLLSSSTV